MRRGRLLTGARGGATPRGGRCPRAAARRWGLGAEEGVRGESGDGRRSGYWKGSELSLTFQQSTFILSAGGETGVVAPAFAGWRAASDGGWGGVRGGDGP